MSKPKTISIDGVDYIRADFQPKPGPLSLVIMHRGFIYVGEVEEQDDGDLSINNASNVRKWSSGGIGGLTLGAKSSGAVLDKCADLVVPSHAVLSAHSLPEGWGDA